VKTARTARLNALFVQARRRGDALYESDFVPRCPAVPAGFDPLAEAIRQGHAAGLEVHAWLPLMPAWSSQAGPKPPAGHILVRHPEWATSNSAGRRMRLSDGGEGIFLDPGVPEVQDALVDVIEEIAQNYPELDGIHLDYVRYPGPQWGYNPVAVARFKRETGHTPSGAPDVFSAWRRDQVTDLVARIRGAVRDANPRLRLSAAVFADRHDAYLRRLQDWPAWMADGLVDFVCPMNYATTSATFARRSKDALSRPGAPAYIGIGAWNKPVASSVRQAQSLRALGAGGMLFYDYANTNSALWPALAKSLFRDEAPTPWAERVAKGR
jgi:uncharacterized lipoprotein YddW (UPF0748 family)